METLLIVRLFLRLYSLISRLLNLVLQHLINNLVILHFLEKNIKWKRFNSKTKE